jgi:predicted phosphodiesterase
MRIAVLADIHGNSIALDAVLADIRAIGGVQGYWVLGDLVAMGHDPVGVMERLAELPNAVFIRGNTNRCTVSGDSPNPLEADVLADLSLLPIFGDVNRSFGWTQGTLAATGWQDWLNDLPLDYHLTLPSGTRVLLVHASPGTDDGKGFNVAMSDAEMGAQLGEPEADVVLVGHTHWPFDRQVNGTCIINVGSIRNPYPPDLRASYLLFDINEDGYGIEFRRVEYDHQAVIDAVRRIRHPGGDYIIDFQEGRILSKWLKAWKAAGGQT